MSGAVVPLRAGGAIAPIIPQTAEDAFRIATAIHKSKMAPRDMDTPEKLLVAILQGLECGLPPMMAVQRIAVINGRPTIWGDAVPALLLAKGFRLAETVSGTGDDRTAHCAVRRPDGDVTERTFSVADAKQAGLWGKAGPWKQYPDRMLAMRARGFAARDGAADVLSGLYLREEIEDEIATATKTAAQAKRDGDFERITNALRECETLDAIDALLAHESETFDRMPEKWREPIGDHITAARARLTAVDVAPEPEPEEGDETSGARSMIAAAVNLAMLQHTRQCYPEADWENLATEYDAKLEALSVAAAE